MRILRTIVPHSSRARLATHMAKPLFKRLGWGVSDQALSSLTNFAMNIVAARTVTLKEFGAFSLVFVTYLIIMGASRALTIDPLLVRYSSQTLDTWRAATRLGSAASFGLGIAGGGICAAVGLASGGPIGPPLIVLGMSLPFLLLQDFWRYAAFIIDKGYVSVLSDLTWTLLLGASLLVIPAGVLREPAGLMAAWGISGSVAALVAPLAFRVSPSWLSPLRWVIQQRDLGLRFLAEFATFRGSSQLAVFAAGAVGGLATLAILRLGQIIYGPLNIFFMGIQPIAISEAARRATTDQARLFKLSAAVSAGFAALAMMWGVALWLIPVQIGSSLIGSAWTHARSVIPPFAVWMAGMGITTGAVVGMRGAAAAKESLRVRLLVSPLTLGGALLGVIAAGPLGAAWGIGTARGVESVVWWQEFNKLRAAGMLDRNQPNDLVGPSEAADA